MVPGDPSVAPGAIVQAVHGVARQAETAVREVPSKSAVPWCSDETGWARTGATAMFGPSALPANDTIRGWWEVLDSSFSGVLVSDFYAAYNHYPGLKQRCWAHLLRDIHDLKGLYPEDAWLSGPRRFTRSTRRSPSPSPARPSHPANA